MGFDKPDLGFVVHFGAPSSPVSYYQHIGRAGRGTEHAEAVLLPGVEDQRIWEYFATASMPDQHTAQAVLDATGSPQSVPALSSQVDLSHSRLELLIKILAVDDAVVRVKGGWQATGKPWQYDAQRYAHVAAQRVVEQNLMLEYQQTEQCRMGSFPTPWTTRMPKIAAGAITVWNLGYPWTSPTTHGATPPGCSRVPAWSSHRVACGPPVWQIWASG